ncbi:AraC family transcriptional regulator [Plantactinospora mayteni]|uniref:AraC family transcriptional regulator n=1 Tax=Plantactinospora mayteni TaxID=566021 RepID=A0ABQ4EV97_9ACTN|nr:AraC family transcriptional regulator [Plantactinospora mayteni]GIG98575.1 AraC family transcriptional regulator [Plantactinospora mayteni]
MPVPTGQPRIEAWSVHGVLLERYRYAPGPAVAYPRHAHEEYQLCLNFGLPGRVWYDRAWHTVPPRSLAVVPPGEVHETRDVDHRGTDADYRVFYLDPGSVADTAVELTGRPTGQPRLPDLVVPDDELFRRFTRLHRAYQSRESRLALDCLTQSALASLLGRHGGLRSPGRRPTSARRAAHQARAYLRDNLASNVSLAELARVANLSPYHLARTFSQEFGLAPHAYLVQSRINLARRLLLAAHSVTEVAYRTGFHDPSHFTRHFTRVVGVRPGRYAESARTYNRPGPGRS